MKLVFAACVLFCIIPLNGIFAQDVVKVMEVPEAAADCMGAIRIVDFIGPIKNVIGRGKVTEIYNSNGQYGFLLTREYNPTWFKFNAYASGLLSLEIKAVKPTDDYNFALYQSPGPWFCKSFFSEFIDEPVRANASDSDVNGTCGISDDGVDEIVEFTGDNSFCSPLKVTKGEEFYLLIDSATKPQSGYTINIKIRETVNE